MSKQWGHGFHSGKELGIETGVQAGYEFGAISVGENAWHCVTAAIRSLERGNDMEALGVLRTLMYLLADSTGREIDRYCNIQK